MPSKKEQTQIEKDADWIGLDQLKHSREVHFLVVKDKEQNRSGEGTKNSTSFVRYKEVDSML